MPIMENEDTEKTMSSDPGIAVVRRNTEEVQGRGNFEVFEELFAADFVDHTPQPGGFSPDRPMVRRIPTPVRYAKKLSGKYSHRIIKGGIGHNLPQEAPQAFAKAVVEVDGN